MPISTERQICCPLCGGSSRDRFTDLRDGLWGIAGEWTHRECPSCEALWLDPRPTVETIGEAYRTYYTHAKPSLLKAAALRAARLAAQAKSASPAVAALIGLAPSVAEQMDLAARYLRPRPGLRLLDVGCGDGASLDWLCDLGWDAEGVEIDPAGVKAAQAQGRKVVLGTAADLPDEEFDVVTSSHVLEHVHDPAGFLAHCRRIVKPGGQVVAVTPNTRSPLLARHGRHWVQLDAPRHLVLFNADNLRDLAERTGFAAVEIRRTARAVAWGENASRAIAERGQYDWNAFPGIRKWLEAESVQRAVSRAVRGGAEGEELVLIATR